MDVQTKRTSTSERAWSQKRDPLEDYYGKWLKTVLSNETCFQNDVFSSNLLVSWCLWRRVFMLSLYVLGIALCRKLLICRVIDDRNARRICGRTWLDPAPLTSSPTARS